MSSTILGFALHRPDAFFFYDYTCLKKAIKLEGVGKSEFLSTLAAY